MTFLARDRGWYLRRVPQARSASSAPSPALQPPPGNPRFPLFDSLRALAALAVVASHVTTAYGTQRTTGWGPYTIQLSAGVPVFFVISGFLLYRPFVAARMGGQPLRLTGYLRRRVFRIVPGYWFALTLLALWPGAPWVAGVFGRDWWVYYGFGQNYSDGTSTHGLGVAWTLCVEVVFYAVLPLYALGAAWLTRRWGLRRGELAGLGLSALGSIVFFGLCADQVVPSRFSATLPGYWYMFVVGMALAVASVSLAGLEPRSRLFAFLTSRPEVGWVGAVVLLGGAATFFSYDWVGLSPRGATQMIGNGVLSVGVAFLLVFPAVFGQERGGLARRILSSRTLTWIGVVSYGVYLWHDPVLLWLADTNGTRGQAAAPIMRIMPTSLLQHPAAASLVLGAVALLLTLVAATVSYYLVELPFLRRKEGRLWPSRREARRATAPVYEPTA